MTSSSSLPVLGSSGAGACGFQGATAAQDGPECIAFPQEMATFRPPPIPEDAAGTAEARAVLVRIRDGLRAWRPFEPGAPAVDLAGLSPAGRAALEQTLGEGEVAARISGSPAYRIRETIFAGLWRVQELGPDGSVARDRLEVADVPAVIRERAARTCRPVTAPPAGPGLMNAPALVNELAEASRVHRAGGPSHVMNLTLLPTTPEDLNHLGAAVGEGEIAILSSGYGSCRIVNTAAGNVWWIRYHNVSGQLILDTIEVTDVPEVVLAAREDLEDTAERLGDWIAALEEA